MTEFLVIKHNYELLNNLFPKIYEKYGTEVHEKISSSIDTFNIKALKNVIDYENAYKYLNRLTKYDKFKNILHDFVIESNLWMCNDIIIIKCLHTMKREYDLNDDDMIELIFDGLDVMYSKNRVNFEISKFWHEVVVKSTNKYANIIHKIRVITTTGLCLDENYSTNVEKYLYEHLKARYPHEIYTQDDLIESIHKQDVLMNTINDERNN